MKKLFLILFVLLFSTNVIAADYTSSGNGDWSNVATWGGGGFPGVGDTATIQAAHTVTIDGDIAVGTNPANTTTYDLSIAGVLQWPAAPGASWTLTAHSSIQLTGSGEFNIGTAGARLDCDFYAIVQMDTSTGQKYYIRVEDGTTLLARGCEGYQASVGTETRARITACSPNCDSGADRVLTLDTTVNWQASTNPITIGGTSNPQVIIGSGGGATDPGADLSEITEATAFPAINQVTVTLANNHQIGDIIVNPTRNILFTSTNPPTQGSIYSLGGIFNISWVAIDEMGDSTTIASITFTNQAKNIGTLSYVAATNCEDGSSVACFYIKPISWDELDHLTAYNVGVSGHGISITTVNNAPTIGSTYNSADHFTAMKGGATSYGINVAAGGYPIAYDAIWVNGFRYNFNGHAQSITNGLFHWAVSIQIFMSALDNYYSRMVPEITDNEFFHTSNDDGIRWNAYTGWFKNNTFVDIGDDCINIAVTTSVDLYFENNTYDNCNDSNIDNQGAFDCLAASGNIYMQGEDFGSTTVNKKSNILFLPAWSITASGGSLRFTCNECILNAPSTPIQTTPIHLNAYTSWDRRAFMGLQTRLAIHNKDETEGDHWGFGPGGMIFERETVTVVDNTLNLKITPYAAEAFRYYRIGSVNVADGDVLSVSVQIRKDEAQAVDRTPRLALKGCGFDVLSNYDAMSDVTDTWETQTVSGTANARGVVHLYIGVIGELDGGVRAEPVDPPTLDIYVDAISYSKS